MTHHESKPMSELVKTVIRRQPVYTVPSVELAQLRAQFDAALAGLRWNQQRERAARQRTPT